MKLLLPAPGVRATDELPQSISAAILQRHIHDGCSVRVILSSWDVRLIYPQHSCLQNLHVARRSVTHSHPSPTLRQESLGPTTGIEASSCNGPARSSQAPGYS